MTLPMGTSFFPSMTTRATLRLPVLALATMHEAVAVNLSLSCEPPDAGLPGAYLPSRRLKTAPSALRSRNSARNAFLAGNPVTELRRAGSER